MKNENRISGIGSFKLIWPPRSFMAQSVSLEGVSAHMLPAVVLVLTRTNEHTVAGVLFFLDGALSLVILMILAGQILGFFVACILALIVFPQGHVNALYLVFLIFGCTVCAITLRSIVAMMLVGAISSNVDLPDLLP